jgi:iron(III) transport system substrate-binding protein
MFIRPVHQQHIKELWSDDVHTEQIKGGRVMKRSLFLSLVIIFLSTLATGILWGQGKFTKETEEWLKKSELGSHEPRGYDEKQIYEKAKLEKSVSVYSYSSRVHQFGKTFEQQYPGIKVNGFDMDSTEIVTKVLAEQKAGNFAADVIFLKDPSTVHHELLQKGLAFTYVPPDLKSVLPERFQKPFLVHHVSLDVLIYNVEANKTVPVQSLWDLTRPEWKSRVSFPDPVKMPEFIEFLATVVQHGDEMAGEYQRVFGKPIQLGKGVKNAGYEWILRVLKNDAVIAGSTNDVSNAVGQPGQQKPPVGITAFSRLRDKEKNPKLAFDVAYDVKPVLGITTEVVIAIVNQAKHPNAAKLMTRWMMGDEKGGQGYNPYFVLGDVPVRTDQPAPKGSRTLAKMNVWMADPAYVWDYGQEIRDFWLANLK